MRSSHRTSGVVGPALTVGAAILVVGIAYGSAATAAGLPGWFVVLTAVVVLGASSELLFVGVIAAGGLPLVAAAAALIVNLRNAVYGVSAASFLPRGRVVRALSAHLVNDESVALALARRTPAERRATFRAVGIAILVGWPVGAALGVIVGSVVPDPGRLGLDAAFPAVFVAILLGGLTRRTAPSAALGAGVAVAATPFVMAGLAPILGLAGLAVGIVPRRRAGRAQDGARGLGSDG